MTRSELLNLEGRVAIVTGGASGMGTAIARRLDEAGAKVVVVDRNPQTPSIVAEAVPGAAAVVADVSEPHIHADVVAAAAEPFGLPSILTNDGGVYPHAPLPQMTAEFFDETYKMPSGGCERSLRARPNDRIKRKARHVEHDSGHYERLPHPRARRVS